MNFTSLDQTDTAVLDEKTLYLPYLQLKTRSSRVIFRMIDTILVRNSLWKSCALFARDPYFTGHFESVFEWILGNTRFVGTTMQGQTDVKCWNSYVNLCNYHIVLILILEYTFYNSSICFTKPEKIWKVKKLTLRPFYLVVWSWAKVDSAASILGSNGPFVLNT